MRPVNRQQGWIGILALVFALAVVGLLAKTALKQYGLLPGSNAAAEVGSADGQARSRTPPGRRIVPDNAEPVPADPMEQVRRLRDNVRDQAEGMAQRIDGATR